MFNKKFSKTRVFQKKLSRWLAFAGSSVLIASLWGFATASLAESSAPNLVIAEPLVAKSVDHLLCRDFDDWTWDAIDAFPLNAEPFPPRAALSQLFSLKLEATRQWQETDLTAMSQAFGELYQLLSSDALETLHVDVRSQSQTLHALSALELGDRSTTAKAMLQLQIRKAFQKLQSIALRAKNLSEPVDCQTSPEDTELSTHPRTGRARTGQNVNSVVYGALKAMATAYQSCSVLDLPAMTKATPNVQGIEVVGHHHDGVGDLRKITDLDAFLRTNYYFVNQTSTSTKGSSESTKPTSKSCFDVHASPLIYNYGGKPYVGVGENPALDFFKIAGDGGNVLGIDCSGFVYSALATSGLRLTRGKKIKAIYAQGIGSEMFANPEDNGLSCLHHVDFQYNESLRAGDILATDGHVVIIVRVGADPLGLKNFASDSECARDNVSVDNFDFDIVQSSTSKNGIGVNKSAASGYFEKDMKLTAGLKALTVQACHAHFRHSTIASSSDEASLVRHIGTSDCLDDAIALAHESCVASCTK